jgi:hypothetical protein
MRSIIDQNGTKWTVSIYGPQTKLGVDEVELVNDMTLLFESNSGESRHRRTAKRALDTFSDEELLYILNKDDEQ